MVDFQSRDTSRGVGEEDDADEEADEADGEDAAATEGDPEPAPAADEAKGESTRTTDAPSAHGENSSANDEDPLAPDTSGAADEGDDQPEPVESASDANRGAGSVEAADRERANATEQDHESHVHEPDHTQNRSRDHDEHETEPTHDHDHGHDHSHAHAHGDVGQIGVAVVTVSSTRDRESDPSGDAIVTTVEEADHEVVIRDVVVDDLDGIQRAILSLTGRDDVDVVVTTGGTGVTPDDVTVEAAKPLFDKSLPGFGELFRILSYEEVGTRALGSRATAGVSEGVPVFCLPGSEAAVRLGMEELVIEEMAHLVGLATRSD